MTAGPRFIESVYLQARIHAIRSLEVEELGEALVRDARREAVDEQLVAPGHAGFGDLLLETRDRASLGGLEAREVVLGECASQVELALRPEAGEPPRERRGRERWIVESDDDSRSGAGAGVPREVRSGPNIRHRVLDDTARRSIERAGGRSGGYDERYEAGEEREASHERVASESSPRSPAMP